MAATARRAAGRADEWIGGAAGEVSGKMDCAGEGRKGPSLARSVWEKLGDKKVMSADTICPYSQDSRLAFGLRGEEGGNWFFMHPRFEGVGLLLGPAKCGPTYF